MGSKIPRVTIGEVLDYQIVQVKADFEKYTLADIPSWRNKVRANALKEMRGLDLTTWQWGALKETAKEMFKENRTVGGEDTGSHSVAGNVTSDPARHDITAIPDDHVRSWNNTESQEEK